MLVLLALSLVLGDDVETVVAPGCELPTAALRVLSPADACWAQCCRSLDSSGCPPACKTRVRKAWRSIAQSHEKGTSRTRKATAAAEKPAELSRRLGAEAQQIHANAAELTRSFERAVGEMQRQGRMTQAAAVQLQAMQGRVQEAQSGANSAGARASMDWSAPGLAAIAGAGCVRSHPISEKLFKGGSTTSVPKIYRFEVCPFFNVSQREEDAGAWQCAEAAAKGDLPSPHAADAIEVGADGSVSISEPSAAAPMPLGFFRGWVPLEALDAHMWATGALESPRPSPPPLTPRPPPLQDGPGGVADAAAFYDSPWDVCRAGPTGPTTTRRAYVLHVCPGLTPRQHAAAAALVRRPWPARAPQGDAWDASAAPPSPLLPDARRRGDEDAAVVHVAEDGICSYLVVVATALACSRELAVAALAQATGG